MEQKYIVIEESNGERYQTQFEYLSDANRHAMNVWECMTKQERKTGRVYVGIVKHYGILGAEIEIPAGAFDSRSKEA